jgi:type IV pilus assembly protein PilY1
MYKIPKKLATAAAIAILGFAGQALAGTVIYNTGNAATATVALGINDDGSLNTTPNITDNADVTGLAFKFADGSWQDGTAPGCFCEGWGVAVNGTVSGSANADDGTFGLTIGALSNVSGSSVTTTATLASLPGISVTQEYAPTASGALFRAKVTISNTTGATVNDVQYVRVMDWDIPPTEFSELVTIKGVASTTFLVQSHDNGFASADPLAPSSGSPGTNDVDFSDNGPDDHGAYFRFNFGSLLDGESSIFNIFYGAASSEAAALAAIGAEGIELYSLGQQSDGGVTGEPATYIFGFSGVGGVPVVPPNDVPEPGTLLLSGLALAALAVARRRLNARS